MMNLYRYCVSIYIFYALQNLIENNPHQNKSTSTLREKDTKKYNVEKKAPAAKQHVLTLFRHNGIAA